MEVPVLKGSQAPTTNACYPENQVKESMMTGQELRESHGGVTAELSCEGGWGSQGQKGERIPAAGKGAQGRHSSEQQPLVACGLMRGQEEAPWGRAELPAPPRMELLCARLSCSGCKAPACASGLRDSAGCPRTRDGVKPLLTQHQLARLPC